MFTFDEIEDAAYETEVKETQRHLSGEFFALVKVLYEQVNAGVLSIEEMSNRLGLDVAQTTNLLQILGFHVIDTI